MPSPVGHALGGLAAGWLVGGLTAPPGSSDTTMPNAASRRARVAGWRAIGYAALGTLADADFLFGTHSTYSHSLGAVVLVGVVVALSLRRDRARIGLACAAAYGTHLLFDWLGSDTSAPVGIMALWPLSDGFYQSPLQVFDAISRRYWLPGFWAHNALAMARELAILVPVVLLVFRWQSRSIAAPGRRRDDLSTCRSPARSSDRAVPPPPCA